MERIGVIGISWKRGGTQELARFTWPAEDRVQATVNLMEQADLREAFYLATCNRVEVAFVRDGKTPAEEYRSRIFTALTGAPPAPGEAERMLQEWTGEGAAEHLFMVVAGLDSAKLGENEIAGQVRKARDVAREAGTMGPRLEQVFDEAFKVAARVHQNTGIGTGRVSLAEIALERATSPTGAHTGVGSADRCFTDDGTLRTGTCGRWSQNSRREPNPFPGRGVCKQHRSAGAQSRRFQRATR